MTDYERVEKVIRYLEAHYLEQPRLESLAKVAGLSEFHFHRLFSRWAGVTPKAFLKFLTAEHAKACLASSADVLGAAMESGLSGPGRLHDLLVSVEAMSPGELKRLGEGLEIRFGFHESPFGTCLIGLTERGVCHLAFCVSKAEALSELKSRWPKATFVSAPRATAIVLRAIFPRARSRQRRRVSVLLAGTPFQLKVWQALLRVPEGAVVSYSGLAAALHAPKAARAVASAVARNSIAYLIPCHRVIRESGRFGEYRWGGERKRAMVGAELK